jgi:muconolactone delta-isomerase
MKQCSRLKTRIGKYNIRALYEKGKLAQLSRVMGEYNLAVLDVSEVRCNGNGRTDTTICDIFVYSGKPNADDDVKEG